MSVGKLSLTTRRNVECFHLQGQAVKEEKTGAVAARLRRETSDKESDC